MTQASQEGGTLAARILSRLKPEAMVTRIEYEGPRIAIYTDNPKYFVDNGGVVGQLVTELRKRVIVKSSESVRKPAEEVRSYITSVAPREAGINRIFFDAALGEVLIEAANSKLLQQVPELSEQELFVRTGWRPRIRQSSPISSPAMEQVYYALSDADERMSFLRRAGERIFRDRIYPRSEVVLTVLGAAREVGRSCMLLSTPESRILLDCGVHPGAKGPLNAYPRLDWLDMTLDDLDAVVISHAHLDHVGFVPVLFKHGYRGPVYMTEPTLALSTLLLMDAIRVAQSEGAVPPYNMEDLRTMISHTITLPYNSVTDITPDVKLTLYNAGHILGSAVIHLHIGDGAHNVVYTGDFKFDNTRLFQAAFFNFPRAETLVMESTYGSRSDVMPTRMETEQAFAASLRQTLEGGGKVLIPVPAVGRAQEIMLVINELVRTRAVPEVPVYLEGMLKEATGIHILYSDYLSPTVKSEIRETGANPFLAEWYTVVDSPKRRSEIVSEGGPSVILATSGMLEGGPSVYYFSELAEDPRNKILFVSYQVPGTTGRRLLDSATREISLFDPSSGRMRVLRVNAAVERIEGFSGHSDFNQLTRYVSRLQRKVRRVLVVHGERKKSEEFAYHLQQHLKVNAYAPQLLDSVRLY
jgi:KH/beta-lactamase-domain protein